MTPSLGCVWFVFRVWQVTAADWKPHHWRFTTPGGDEVEPLTGGLPGRRSLLPLLRSHGAWLFSTTDLDCK